MEIMKLPETLTLETERLILKEMNPALHHYIYTNLSDEDIMEQYHYTQAEVDLEREKYKYGVETYQISFKNFIMLDKNTSELVGRIGYHTWYVRHSRAEIGYAVAKEEQKNKGYTSEAMKAILIYGFDEMQLNRVEARVGEMNAPSIRLMEKFGFVKEGIMRQDYIKGEVVHDSALFSLLSHEYEKLKGNWK